LHREVKAADAARVLYQKLGRPGEAEFDSILLPHNLLRNCPITPGDAKRALVIYGTDVAVLKGKGIIFVSFSEKKRNCRRPESAALVTSKPTPDFNKMRLEFGA
jgi:hypothetical protein